MSNDDVEIRFSRPQIEALHYALGETLDHGDVLAALFPSPGERRAALNAYAKIKMTIREMYEGSEQ